MWGQGVEATGSRLLGSFFWVTKGKDTQAYNIRRNNVCRLTSQMGGLQRWDCPHNESAFFATSRIPPWAAAPLKGVPNLASWSSQVIWDQPPWAQVDTEVQKKDETFVRSQVP